jgi:poly(3-hydroxyalkanoate) synthetase
MLRSPSNSITRENCISRKSVAAGKQDVGAVRVRYQKSDTGHIGMLIGKKKASNGVNTLANVLLGKNINEWMQPTIFTV